MCAPDRVADTLRWQSLVFTAFVALFGCGGGSGSSQGGTSPAVKAPSIASQPAAASVAAGSTASFVVTATGSPPLSYQWQLSTDNGTTWSGAPGAATSASYATPITTLAFNGYRYRVQVSNAAGTATSSDVVLTVTPAASVERQVLATSTDSNITATPTGGEAPHLAINPSASVVASGKLLVFLPGTQGRPSQYTYILRAAASRGFHAIGVNYPNQTAMGTLCQTSPEPDCYWIARSEVVFGGGTPVSGQTAVTQADSIVNRVNKLLLWLKNNHPSEGWGLFLLGNDTVDWSKVMLAGHSQGGGHVGVLAKTVALGRAVYFSSPDDWQTSTNTPARWTLTRPNVTPASQQYGFGSDFDTLVPNDHAYAHWNNLGLYKPASGPVLVDGGDSPFSDSHQLHTSRPHNPASTAGTQALRNHGITVVDTSTPIDGNGRPLFDTNGVWEYLCFR